MPIFRPDSPNGYSGELTVAQMLSTAQKGDVIPLLTGVKYSVIQSDVTGLVDRWNAVAVQVFGPTNQVVNVTILESMFGENQFLPVADPQGTQYGLTNGASFVCQVGQPFIKAKLDLVGVSQAAGSGWTVYARPFRMAASPGGSGLYPYGTTGPISSGNLSQTLTFTLADLRSVAHNEIFDAKQVMLALINNATGQTLTGATLTFKDTTPGGTGLTILYPIDFSSIGNGVWQFFTIKLDQGILPNVSMSVSFGAAPTTGSVDCQLYFQGAGGTAADPTTGLDIVTAPISTAASGATAIVSAAYGNQSIYVVSYALVAASAVTVEWLGGGGGSNLSGVMSLAANGGISIATSAPSFLLNTAAGQNLSLSLGGAVQVSGHLTYFTRAN